MHLYKIGTQWWRGCPVKCVVACHKAILQYLLPSPHSFLPSGCNSSPYANERYHGGRVPLPKYAPCLLNDPEK